MRKLVVLLCGILLLSGCSLLKKAPELELPTENYQVVVLSGDEMISEALSGAAAKEVIELFQEMRRTRKQSVQDPPYPYQTRVVDIKEDNGKWLRLYFYEEDGTYYAEYPYVGIYETTQETIQELWNYARLETDQLAIFVNEQLYLSKGEEDTTFGKCGVMDGKITSSGERNEVPTQNNQSNFGIGFEYQYGMNGTINVVIEGKWIVFERYVNYGQYQLVEDLEVKNVDTHYLVKFNGVLYGKSNKLIDYLGGSESIGVIEYQIDENYVPKEDGETNSKELLGANVYDQTEHTIVLCIDNGFTLFEAININY